MHVRQVARMADDGFRAPLVPGLKREDDARRLAEEIGVATGRLEQLALAPTGLYAEVASAPDAEEALWLAFLIAYLGPLEDDDPFAAISAARVPWAGGAPPRLEDVATGVRTAHDPARGTATPQAYRAWAARAGSQAEAFAGEPSWTPERRFRQAFERLSLPGFHRAARFDLLVTLGRLGRIDARAGALRLGGSDLVTTTAKRAFGIGDSVLLERRAAELAEACGVPLEALDLALENLGRPPGERLLLGASPGSLDEAARGRALAAIGL
ncbi:MAG TPA: hypothetical protein VGN78_10085 [Solirubrobacteraceae bacterium]|nr:hypothetical protein [Solirubrobacteraceae bacterium]